MRTVVLTRISSTDFFTVAKVIAQHTDSDSVGDRSVVADKDTYERDWRMLVVWRLQVVVSQSPGTSTEDRIRHDFLPENFRHSRRFSQLQEERFTDGVADLSLRPVPHFIDECDGLCPQHIVSSIQPVVAASLAKKPT